MQKSNHSKKNTNSINYDTKSKEISLEIEESKTVTKSSIEKEWKTEGNKIEKITPYSLKNLTSYKIKIMSSDLYTLTTEITETLELANRFSGGNTTGSGGALKEEVSPQCKTYSLQPGEECEYAVDVDKQTNDLLN